MIRCFRPAGAILDFLKRKIMEKELSFEEARELARNLKYVDPSDRSSYIDYY